MNRKWASMALVVPSWDGYADVWPGFVSLLNRFWPSRPLDTYLVTGERTPELDGVTVLPVGPDRGFSINLTAGLRHVDAEWILLWLDDLYPTTPVCEESLLKAVEEAEARRAGFVSLNSSPHAVTRTQQGCGVILPVHPASAYAISLTVGLWRRAALTTVLDNGKNPWALERFLTTASLGELGVYKWNPNLAPPVQFVNGIRNGKLTIDAKRLLEKEGVEIWPARPVQTPFCGFGLKVYRLLRQLAKRV